MTDNTFAQFHRPRDFLRKYPIAGGLTKLYQLINSGMIVARKDGKTTLIPDAEGQKYLQSLPGYTPWAPKRAA